VLIESGANVNQRNRSGVTPTRAARKVKNASVVALLKENGAR